MIRGHVLDREKNEAAAISERPFADKIVLKPENIKPWTLSQPLLYTLSLEMVRDGAMVDSLNVRFGFRTVAFTDQRIFLKW